jgi:uracil-DNA glycosylase family 4
MIEELLTRIKNCRECEKFLMHGVNPVLSASVESKIVIIGQAPGRIVHQTGIPWNDKSGDNLRNWLGVDKTLFYDNRLFALVPMGFCYPGTGKNGDLPPRKECAPLWHQQLLDEIRDPRLIILVGQYAQHYYLKDAAKSTLTETAKHFKEYLPQYIPLPHPSPRNNIWQAKNPWFTATVLPLLKQKIQEIIEHK